MAEGGDPPEIRTLINKVEIAHVKAETANVQSGFAEINVQQAVINREKTEIGTVINHAEKAQVEAETANVQAQTVEIKNADINSQSVKIDSVENVTILKMEYVIKDKLKSDNLKTQDFLDAIKQQTLRSTTPKQKSQFKDLHQLEEEIFPKMTVVTMTGNAEEKVTNSDKVIGSDLYEIQLHQLHNDHEGKSVNHVLILGDPGEGKTVSAMRYSNLAIQKRVEALKDVELVHFVQVSKLQSEANSTAFALLFYQQVALTEEMGLAGQEWLKKNASKFLLILDGLDQSRELFAGDFPNIEAETPVPTNVILANLFSGHVYPGMKILTTARWSSYWCIKKDQLPHKTVALRGFDDCKIQEIIPKLSGEEKGKKILEYLWSKALDLRSLCRTPLFLSYVTQVLVKDLAHSPDTLSGIMVSVLRYFFRSYHTEIRDVEEQLQSYIKLAFNGIKMNRFIFSSEYVKSFGLDIKDLQDLLAADAKVDEFASEVEDEDLELFFCHQTIQEILAAIYVCNMAAEEFKGHLEEDHNQPVMEVVRKFAYGILLNDNTRKLAQKYLSEASKKNATIASAHLRELVGKDEVKDVKFLLLMHECGSKVIRDLQPIIKVIDLSWTVLKPSEIYPVTSVIAQCNSLSSVSFGNLTLDPSILHLMQIACKSIKAIDAQNLTIGDQLQQSDCAAVMEIICKVNIMRLYFNCSDNVVKELGRHFAENEFDVQINSLAFGGSKNFESDSYRVLSDIVSPAKIDSVYFRGYNLTITIEKLHAMNVILTNPKIKVLVICKEKTMQPECYKELARILDRGNIERFYVRNCDATAEKIEAFIENSGIPHIRSKLTILGFQDSKSSVSDDEFNCLRRLIPLVSDGISVTGWMLSSVQQVWLQDFVNALRQEVKSVWFGKGGKIEKEDRRSDKFHLASLADPYSPTLQSRLSRRYW